MARVRNVLFIMADQLRADYLSAYGHPTLKTSSSKWASGAGVTW